MTALATTVMHEPSLQLDKRQRAMLKEMGVQVWQPLPVAPVAPVATVATAAVLAKTVATPASAAPKSVQASQPAATNSGAGKAYIQGVSGTFDTRKQAVETPKEGSTAESGSAWRIGTLQTLYQPVSPASTARWLVLLESPANALSQAFNPFEGDAGKLLDNMLRAAKLHTAGAAMLAPLVRGNGLGGDFPSELADIVASSKASLVLVMGRLAAQALLQSTEPLAKLRGHTHHLHSTPTIVSIDPAYLLRNPLDKAKAWDDLCLAIGVASGAHPTAAA